jgi:predicted DNA-binding transcriptional regulator AlpA
MRRCIDWKVLKTIIPWSRAHILRMETEPEYHHGDPFPARLRLGNGHCRICWWLDEVMAWLERRPRGVVQTNRSE